MSGLEGHCLFTTTPSNRNRFPIFYIFRGPLKFILNSIIIYIYTSYYVYIHINTSIVYPAIRRNYTHSDPSTFPCSGEWSLPLVSAWHRTAEAVPWDAMILASLAC